ncbi:hypothetical protein [Paenibacillus odorifer]|uniref:hypothetical protein n=1 Tax=Paenibacillus odorifer TaxID=189426 RepID=UPI00096DB1F9|nr:hypothetical protein [Paenibacillus odorifer]OMD76583.1 hypothetical protein BSK50_14905 [Paenibacillus odorifer]
MAKTCIQMIKRFFNSPILSYVLTLTIGICLIFIVNSGSRHLIENSTLEVRQSASVLAESFINHLNTPAGQLVFGAYLCKVLAFIFIPFILIVSLYFKTLNLFKYRHLIQNSTDEKTSLTKVSV